MDVSIDNAPLLSILVPTKNRMSTLVPTVRGILNIPSKQLEVVVQDCSDTDALGDHLACEFQDPRLRYYHSGRPLSMTDNFNAGLDRTCGEYVCVIGDDDGVNPEITDIARWAKANDLDAVSQRLDGFYAALYFWPDNSRKRIAGTLQIRDFTGEVTFPDCEAELRESSFGFGQKISRLPKVYHGVVRRERLLTLKERTGAYIDGLSPDVYSAVAFSAVTRKYALVDYPVTIVGSAGNSNSSRQSDKRITKQEQANIHLREYREIHVPKELPDFLDIYTTLTESMIKAYYNTGRTDLVSNINYPLLFASSAVYDIKALPTITRHFLSALTKNRRPILPNVARYSAYIVARIVQKGILTIPRVGINNRDITSGLATSEAAMAALSTRLQSKDRRFDPESGPN